MDTFYIILICVLIALVIGFIIYAIIGMIVANKTAKKMEYKNKRLTKATLLGAFTGDLLIVKNNWDKIEVILDGENFYFQKNPFYSLYTSRWYAKFLKENYYLDSKRTVKGLDYELAGHYIFYIIKNRHAVDGSYLGTDYNVDKSAKLFEIIAKFLP